MTLDKAIEIYEKGAKLTWNGKPTVEAEECQQMVEWLKELQAHREAWEGLRHDVYELHEILFNMKPQHRTTTVAGDILDLINAYRPKEGDSNADID